MSKPAPDAISPEEIQRDREIIMAVTPPPWTWGTDYVAAQAGTIYVFESPYAFEETDATKAFWKTHAAFVVAARERWWLYIAAVESLQAELRQAQYDLGESQACRYGSTDRNMNLMDENARLTNERDAAQARVRELEEDLEDPGGYLAVGGFVSRINELEAINARLSARVARLEGALEKITRQIFAGAMVQIARAALEERTDG